MGQLDRFVSDRFAPHSSQKGGSSSVRFPTHPTRLSMSGGGLCTVTE